MNKIDIKVERVDKVSNILLDYGFSYNAVCKMLRTKDVRIDNSKIPIDQDVFAGQTVTCFCKELPENKFEVVFEDENVLVLNKKSGIEVVGENSLETKTGAIAVHRIDRNTEGLVIMAKNKEAEEDFLNAIKERSITKKYLCEVVGFPKFDGRTYSAYLFKDSKNSVVKVYNKKEVGSVQIETKFKLVKKGTETSVISCELITGKTHQIRAHLAFLGYPILGDMKYGSVEKNKKLKEKNQKLHCYYLKIMGLKKLDYLNGREIINLPVWAKNINLGEKDGN